MSIVHIWSYYNTRSNAESYHMGEYLSYEIENIVSTSSPSIIIIIIISSSSSSSSISKKSPTTRLIGGRRMFAFIFFNCDTTSQSTWRRRWQRRQQHDRNINQLAERNNKHMNMKRQVIFLFAFSSVDLIKWITHINNLK